jgi:hypothetical protein
MRNLLFLIVVFISFVFYSIHKNEQDKFERQERKDKRDAECLASLSCQNNKAQFQSLVDSSTAQSISGQIYYRGMACEGVCEAEEAGYEWAEENQIEDEYDCDDGYERKVAFWNGCKIYVQELIEINEEFQLDNPDNPDFD